MEREEETTLLDALACEIAARPAGAPTFSDLLPFRREVKAENGEVVIAFGPQQATSVEAFAAAERLCCPDLDWIVETSDPVRLRIRGTEAQVALLEQVWRDA